MKGSLKPAIVFPLITLLLMGCSNAEKVSEEEELINDVFVEAVGKEGYYLPPLPPPFPLEYMENPTREDSVQYYSDLEKARNSFRNPRIDSSVLQLVVRNILGRPDHSLMEIQDVQKTSVFQINYGMDSTWIPLYSKLISINDTSTINLKDLTKTGKYTLVDNETYKIEQDGVSKVGTVRFSQVAFSEDRKRAIFTVSIVLGPLSGGGYLILCEKINGTWTVLHREMIWVA